MSSTPRAVTLRAPLLDGFVEFAARLLPFRDGSEHAAVHPSSWFITHALGTPAGDTYTEVLIEPELCCRIPQPEYVLDAVVRHLADQMYGHAWAFHYRPDQYAGSIEPYGMARRERILVEEVEVQ